MYLSQIQKQNALEKFKAWVDHCLGLRTACLGIYPATQDGEAVAAIRWEQ